MMSKHICFILDFYPTEDNHACVFARNLIYAMAESGIKCTVISPQAITMDSIKRRYPFHRTEYVSGNPIEIYMPYYLYLTSKKQLIRFSMNNHYNAVIGILNRHKIHPDIIYGHFIFQCGLTASRVAKKLGIPAYCACGENSTRLKKDSVPYSIGIQYGNWRQILNNLSGVISVSSYNKQLLIENGFVSQKCRIKVLPNGVDKRLFYPMDKKMSREKLSFPKDKFIVLFNGSFSERKGFGVVCNALRQCEDVFSIFLGNDTIRPDCSNVLFSGKVKPENVPMYLNAADVMVLPTLGEGCCNAIVEALACGLPVISSNLPFNDDILDNTNSVRVNPLSVDEVVDAINYLKDNSKLLKHLSQGALVSSDTLDIKNRALRIGKFMEEI